MRFIFNFAKEVNEFNGIRFYVLNQIKIISFLRFLSRGGKTYTFLLWRFIRAILFITLINGGFTCKHKIQSLASLFYTLFYCNFYFHYGKCIICNKKFLLCTLSYTYFRKIIKKRIKEYIKFFFFNIKQ